MDSLLKPAPSTPDNNIQEPTGNFKFFQPDTASSAPTTDSQSALDSLLLAKDNSTSLPTTPDTLLTSNVPNTEPQEQKMDVPYLDTYNNPFAHNPIFSDDVEKIMGKKIETAQEMPKLDFNGCLNTVRDAVKKIELSGFKVESEEMNFEKNYQIVIKIAKKEE